MANGDGTQTKHLGERLFELCLKDPSSRVVKCNGWKGIGRWRIAEEATKIAMESHLFDVFIWVKLSREEWGPRNLQMGIAKHLGIKFPRIDGDGGEEEEIRGYIDEDVAEAIRAKLKGKKFLMVVGDVCKAVDLGWVGVPNMRRERRSATAAAASKVVLIGNEDNLMAFDQEFDWEKEVQGAPSPSYAVLAYRQSVISGLFLDEVADVGHASSCNFTPDVVLACLMYLSFFDGKVEPWLIRYWMAEGFINRTSILGGGEEMGMTTVEEEEEEEVVLAKKVIKPLLKELCNRSFISMKCKVHPHLEDRVPYSVIDMECKVHPHLEDQVAYSGPFNLNFKFRISDGPLAEQDYEDEECRSIAITLRKDDSEANLPLCPRLPNLSSLMINRGYHSVQLDITPYFFENMKCLRILHLCCLQISSLPPSISSLHNLRLLRLRNCYNLMAIPSSLQALEKLEFLDLNNCHSLVTIPDEIFVRMSNLRVLDLSSLSRIMSLPSSLSNLHGLRQLLLANCLSLVEIKEESFDYCMQRLQLMNLDFAYSLKSLPSSLFNLVGLKKLTLRNCHSLKALGVHSLRNLSKLEYLDLTECSALEDIQDVSFGDLLPNIKYINLSRMGTANLKRLSFKGCKRLEHLDLSYLESLEELDLSGTIQLKDIYFCASKSEHPLRRLDMLPITYNSGAHDFLFEGLNWDGNDVGARIWVSNTNIFKYQSDEIFKTKCFSRFRIRISSSTEENPSLPMPMGNTQNMHFRRNRFPYKDIYPHIQTYHFSNFRRTYDRHLEIFRCEVPRGPLKSALCHAELITLFDNCYFESLTQDLHYGLNIRFKECRIGSCQNLDTIFHSSYHDFEFKCLELMWVAELPRLATVCKGKHNPMAFAVLKHMHIERCPRLVTVFTSGCYLESLETLKIKFCGRLEYVFGNEVNSEEASLRKLRCLCLLELPKLKSIFSGNLPKLQKMRVRGCRELRKLPLRGRIVDDLAPCDGSAGSVVEIEGRLDWWNNLQWEHYKDNSIERPVRFRPRSQVRVAVRK